MNTGLIPSVVFVLNVGDSFNAIYFSTKCWVQKQRERVSTLTRGVQHSMQSRSIVSSCDSVQHISNVAYESARNRRGIDPLSLTFYLESSFIILEQNGQQSIISVLANTPLIFALFLGWIMEDSEQNQRIFGIFLIKVVLL